MKKSSIFNIACHWERHKSEVDQQGAITVQYTQLTVL